MSPTLDPHTRKMLRDFAIAQCQLRPYVAMSHFAVLYTGANRDPYLEITFKSTKVDYYGVVNVDLTAYLAGMHGAFARVYRRTLEDMVEAIHNVNVNGLPEEQQVEEFLGKQRGEFCGNCGGATEVLFASDRYCPRCEK